MVNKDPINNHYATLLILLSRGEQEEKKTDALTADKDLISFPLFEGKDCIRDSYGFQPFIMYQLCSFSSWVIRLREGHWKNGSPLPLHLNLPCPPQALPQSACALICIYAAK